MGPSYNPTTGMGRFLSGTPPVLGLLAIDAALEIVESAGIPALWAKSQQFTAMLVDLVRSQLEPLGAALASPPTLIGGEPTYRSLIPGHGRGARP